MNVHDAFKKALIAGYIHKYEEFNDEDDNGSGAAQQEPGDEEDKK